jgi:hypothetical protein
MKKVFKGSYIVIMNYLSRCAMLGIGLFILSLPEFAISGEKFLSAQDLEGLIAVPAVRAGKIKYSRQLDTLAETQADFECQFHVCGPDGKMCDYAKSFKTVEIEDMGGRFRNIDENWAEFDPVKDAAHIFFQEIQCSTLESDHSHQSLTARTSNRSRTTVSELARVRRLRDIGNPAVLRVLSEAVSNSIPAHIKTKVKDHGVPVACLLGTAALQAGLQCGENRINEEAKKYLDSMEPSWSKSALEFCGTAFAATGLSAYIKSTISEYTKNNLNQALCPEPTAIDQIKKRIEDVVSEYSSLSDLYKNNRDEFQIESQVFIEKRLESLKGSITSLSLATKPKDLREVAKDSYAPLPESEKQVKWLKKVIQALPRHAIQLDETEYRDSLKVLLKSYPKEFRKQIEEFTYQLKDHSKNTKKDLIGKNILFILGSPGTGKTRFIERYGDIVGLPSKKVTFKSVEDLNGGNYHNPQVPPGVIARSLEALKATNGLIIIDEVDKVLGGHDLYSLKEPLLVLLDPSKPTFLDNGFGVGGGYPVDISRLTLIMVGNEIPDVLKNTPGMRRRMIVIKMPSLEVTEKKEIARQLLKNQIQKNSHRQFREEDLTESDTRMLNQICELDKSEGVAIIEKVISDFLFYRERIIEKSAQKGIPVSNEMIEKFDIAKSFSKYSDESDSSDE